MKTQEEINALFNVKIGSSLGPVSLLQQPTREVPGLRKPYQYEVSAADGKQLVKDLQDMLNPLDNNSLQCSGVSTKPTKYGIRLDVFLLGFRPGFCGDSMGCTDIFWQGVTLGLINRLKQTLGSSVLVYVEPWTDKEKFQARFETYIKYREL